MPLIALSYLSISQQDRINSVYTQIATFNPFSTTEIIKEEVIKTNPIKNVEIIKSPKIIETSTEIIKEEVIETNPIKNVEIIETSIAEEVTTPIMKQQHTFYVIAGAFAEQKNANNLLAKLNKWNYNAEIVEGGNLIRVSYNSFTNKRDAILALKEIRKENPSAWLLTK